jgi:hypothetical protein
MVNVPALRFAAVCAILASCHDPEPIAREPAQNADESPVARVNSPPPTPGVDATVLIEDVAVPVPGSVLEALREHAAGILHCPKGQVNVRDVTLGRAPNPSDFTFADGCGQRLVYGAKPRVSGTPSNGEFYVVSRFSM